jgi:F0F1-type ATP synthase epsilon subunit
MLLKAYHKAINQGFSESEACKIADEAFEQYQIDQAKYAAEMEAQYAAEMEAQYAAEMETQAKAEFDAALAAERMGK